jgi:triphosphoribosyl-dephospho-CoA synthetase
MTRGLTERDFAGLTEESARTSGQRLYLRHGITGVRGQAEAGFPLVRDVGLPALEAALHRGLSMNDACLAALTALMSENTDTNVISRSSTARLQQLRSEASLLLSSEPFPDVDRLLELDRELIRENISPGGSADLLALCCFLHFLKEEEHLGL